MKKKLLPLAMLAGLAGAAGTAQAVYINTDGHGETLIYPYYTVEEGQNTYISVTNTTPYYKAVKVRFLEGQNSAEVLDFNLYLSPEDIWTGAIVPSGDGAKIITRDESCTVPWIPRPNDTSEVDGVDFRTFEYTRDGGDGGDQSIERTREGYVEIIEMGTIENTDVQEEIFHDASGKPADCDGLRTRWVGNNVAIPSSSPNFENPGVEGGLTGNGYWTDGADAPANGFHDQTDHASIYRLGGLYGYGVLVNPSEGSGSAYNAVALDQFFGLSVEGEEYEVQHSNPGTTLPSLGSAFPVAQIIDGNSIWDVDFPTSPADQAGWDAVSALFMHDTLSNDFVLDPFVNADTDWVITMPTKRYYVNQGTTGSGDDEEANVLAPFTQGWSGSACEVVGIDAWDREEANTTLTGDIDFSPRPPLAEGPDPSSICTEVNVLMFGEGDALYPSNRVGYGVPDLGHDNGWVRLDLTGTGRVLAAEDLDQGPVNFNGLPVTGFAVQKFINGSMEGGTLANYSWLVQHSYTRDIAVSE